MGNDALGHNINNPLEIIDLLSTGNLSCSGKRQNSPLCLDLFGLPWLQGDEVMDLGQVSGLASDFTVHNLNEHHFIDVERLVSSL